MCQHYTTYVEKYDKGTVVLCHRICKFCGKIIESWLEEK